MAAPFRPRIIAAAVKIEATSGTDAVPTLAANALQLVGVPTLNPSYMENGVRDDVQTGILGTVDRAAPAGRMATIDITLEVRGYGAAYSAVNRPEADVLLRISGMAPIVVTTVNAEKVTYTTLDDAFETATLYLWSANKLFKLVGCVAKPKLSAKALQRGLVTFSVQGKMASDPITTAFSAPTLNQTVPPLFHSAAAQIGLWTTASAEPLIVSAVDLDFGVATAERSSAGATDGYVGPMIADRKARLGMDVEQVTLSTFDPYAASLQNSSGAIDTKPQFQIGTAQYNRLKFFGGRWALEAPRHSDVNSLSGWHLEGNLVLGTEATGGREMRLLFD